MSRFNKSFELTVHDLNLIEEALRSRSRELCKMRRALSDDNPADIETVKGIECDQRDNEELLGRLHNQKVFFRPPGQPYVGG